MEMHPRSTALFTRSNTVFIDPSLAKSFFSGIIISQYLNIALLTVLVYHALITTDKQIKYFWLYVILPVVRTFYQLKNPGRALYWIGDLCCEYSITIHYASNLTQAPDPITVILIDCILQIRVLALYEQNRHLSICLKGLLVLETSIALGFTIYDNFFEDFIVVHIAQGIQICGKNRPPSSLALSIVWGGFLIYGMILLCLALFKAAEYWRISSNFKGFHLVRVLVEDQVIYYGFVIFCCILRITANQTKNVNSIVVYILDSIENPTLLCILGNRLLINLKEAGEFGQNEGTNYWLRTAGTSDIEFAEGSPAAVGPNEEGTSSV
ncbi:uncharacterized protein FOMMEDRAFT_152461 [Fomitiporia mediterranea MF3/22]|uniref:uncharacterized protein n=1 Tax=Fomitiporia mediterranea (strain MF3/22) TaxID=694068 RepID=UPI00044098B2|nr:uncharacterized protein FOMMEDRAFT_152461 [Fomitiporia mediterranea MF3/22]EJD07103.1 hypothetical protein FOMMEDRAFT_152461 [Fomitiporia mediterranea MF3/22]